MGNRNRADYNEWGQITYSAALSITSSYRRIWPQLSYTGHDWDDVLYAKARFYSADDKRFVAMDPIKGQIIEPLSLVPYVYCVDNPLRWVDPLGLTADGVLTAGSYVCIDGTIYVLVASALVSPPVGVTLLFAAGIGLCYIAGRNLYYSPTRSWDNTAREAALKEVEFFADYPVPPYSGPFDISPDEVGVTWPEVRTQEKAVPDTSRATMADVRRGYIDQVECEGAADNTRDEKKETAKPTSKMTGKPAVSGSGEATSGGPKKDDDDDDNDKNSSYKHGEPPEPPENWGMVESEEEPVKSKDFINFLKSIGEKPSRWVKVMEKWAIGDGPIYQRHYWTNGTDYYYHGNGFEPFIPH